MAPADSVSAARAQAHFARDGAIMEWSLARPAAAAEVPQRYCRRRSRFGQPDEIGKAFVGFQQYLYLPSIAA